MIGYSAYVTMDDPESGYYDSDDRIHRALFQLRGTIQDSCQIRALAKCKVSSDWSKIESVGSFSFADEFVSVSERPTGDDEDDGDYDYEDSPPGDASEDFKDRLDEKGEIIPPPY